MAGRDTHHQGGIKAYDSVFRAFSKRFQAVPERYLTQSE
jgi:hypothetical protein